MCSIFLIVEISGISHTPEVEGKGERSEEVKSSAALAVLFLQQQSYKHMHVLECTVLYCV